MARGEPLLMGVEFFRWINEVEQVLQRPRASLRNTLQTNGLLLRRGFFDFISEVKDFYPNISMDGPTFITRKTRGVSSDKYDAIFKELTSLKIPFGVAVVATSEVLKYKDEVIQYFEERGIANVGIVPYHSFSHASVAASATALYSTNGKSVVKDHFTLKEQLPPPTILSSLALKDEKDSEIGLQGITLMGRELVKGALSQVVHSDCRLSSFSDGCHRHVLCVAVNGELYPCPRGQNVGLWNYGNVATGGLEKWWQSTGGPPPFRPQLPTECEPCKHKDICHGGCPANAASMNGGADRRDYYCPSFVRIFDTIDKILVEEMSLASSRDV
jgi:uncharacterized protein